MAYETLLFDVNDHVAQITLNRPKAANALNFQMSKELFQISIQCDEDPAIRAVLLTGAGKLFCGGGDLVEFSSHGAQLAAVLKEMTTYLHGAISRFARMDAPLIVAANGTAGGAGMSFVCAADIAYGAESAKFTLAYTAAGLTPDGSSTYFLPRLVGLRRATELALTNRRLSSQEALEWGILSQVFSDEDCLDEAMKVAIQLANGPTKAYGSAKRLLRQSLNETLETQMEEEAQAIVNATRTADAQEGIMAFLGKRKPKFMGE